MFVVGRFAYGHIQQFIDDLELMAHNAAAYNGADSALAKDAYSIASAVRKYLDAERELGPEKDTVRVTEEVLNTK